MRRFLRRWRHLRAELCLIAVSLATLFSGCALLPDYATVEGEHLSHATQHEPLTDHPTNYGSELLDGVIGWGKSDGPYLELGEGYALGPNEIAGPREQFLARGGWRFRFKKSTFVRFT